MILSQAFGLLLSWACLTAAQSCSTSNPCEIGCCNKFGYCGFGPDYCGDDCVVDCGRKSQCNPGFGSKWAESDKCPLSVCCSKSGFCGTTEQFCGNKKVPHKTCSSSNGIKRVVGYYEGWARKRPCNNFWPEDIPTGIYTHINFAFATINPTTFEIEPASKLDINLYNRLIALKELDPNLKVYVAIGGWTFNDPGPTATTFSDLAASVPRQRKFILSLMSFMSTYGFDGVDLDWEYPGTDDRSGRDVDFANFPKFLSRLRSSLTLLDKGVTITIPASYWYLQHFDIKALSDSVDWFNIMSYDLHGMWDKGNKWTGNFLNAHTNLTEIDLAMDLLWRNDIDPYKVVMGMGFYGRSFTATSPSCVDPGCTFESAGKSGRCSREAGILMNSEIDTIIKIKNLKPKLYEKEAVKVATWDDQWVAYDDADTYRLKAEYAQKHCLGGLMVWAVSHDTKDAKFSKALSKVGNVTPGLRVGLAWDNSGYVTVDTPIDQCKWTNCGQGCPSGWTAMKRSDKYARKGELMLDETGCGKNGGVHTFCCPPAEKQPDCGWYTHNNGKCSHQCPDGTVEVGSNDMYCKRGRYQAACCTTGLESMQAYTTCVWGESWPSCNKQTTCSSGFLVDSSGAGSGGATCSIDEYPTSDFTAWVPKLQRRPLCCDATDKHAYMGTCKWSEALNGTPWYEWDGDCHASCPDDTIRMAMDTGEGFQLCRGAGYRALCCNPGFSKEERKVDPELDKFQKALDEFVKDPTCKNPGLLPVDGVTGSIQYPHLRHREASPEDDVKTLLARLLIAGHGTASSSPKYKSMDTMWNLAIGGTYPNLAMPSAVDFYQTDPELQQWGPIQAPNLIVCNLNKWNKRAGSKTTTCFCPTRLLGYDQDLLNDPDSGKRRDEVSLRIRNARSPVGSRDGLHLTTDDASPEPSMFYNVFRSVPGLEKRVGASESYPVEARVAIFAANPNAGRYGVQDCYDCENVAITATANTDDPSWQANAEHIHERRTEARVQMYMMSGEANTANGLIHVQTTHTPVPESYLDPNSYLWQPYSQWDPNGPYTANGRPIDEIARAYGSLDNPDVMVNLDSVLNGIKSRIWVGHQPMASSTWTESGFDEATTDGAQGALSLIRNTISVISYLNDPTVNTNWATVVNDLIAIYGRYQERVFAVDNVRIYPREMYQEYVREVLLNQLEFVVGYIHNRLTRLQQTWQPLVGTSAGAESVLLTIEHLSEVTDNLSIDKDQFNL